MFCARYRWVVIGAWLALLALAVPFAPQLPGALRSGGFCLNDLEASKARLLLEDELRIPPSAMVVLIQSQTDARAGDPEFELAAAQALARLPVRRARDGRPDAQPFASPGQRRRSNGLRDRRARPAARRFAARPGAGARRA